MQGAGRRVGKNGGRAASKKPRLRGALSDLMTIYACSAMVYKSFSVSAQPRQGSVMDLP